MSFKDGVVQYYEAVRTTSAELILANKGLAMALQGTLTCCVSKNGGAIIFSVLRLPRIVSVLSS